LLGLIASVLVLVTAAAVIAIISRHPAATGARAAPRSGPGSGNQDAIRAAAVTRNLTASWIAHEVSRDAIVSCDPLMCQALGARGIPAGDLLVLRPGARDPLGSELVVATAAVRSQFGSRLASVYAPTVLASFGSGGGAIAVRVIAPNGVRAYDAALAADVRARKVAGSKLRHNRRIALTALAAGQLEAGDVDSRLLDVLVTMAHQNPVRIAAFGDSGPGASAGVPLRSVDLAAVRGAPWAGQSAYVRSVLALLRAQVPPYLAASVAVVPTGDSHSVLRITFPAPNIIGLLPPGAS
jgi:hypothetical protein